MQIQNIFDPSFLILQSTKLDKMRRVCFQEFFSKKYFDRMVYSLCLALYIIKIKDEGENLGFIPKNDRSHKVVNVIEM